MSFVDGSAGAVVIPANPADRDGKDEAALALLKANKQLSNVKIADLLKSAGIKRSREWVRLHREPEAGAGCKLQSE